MSSAEKIIKSRDFPAWRRQKEPGRIVFTNGCFDILHPGHVDYLERALELGDVLVVGLNSDESVKKIKGPDRPVNPVQDRARVLAGLGCVGLVMVFHEDTPYSLIKTVRPHVLVKGGDWPVEMIVGRDIVQEMGGQVFSLALNHGYSTTGIIARIRQNSA